VLHHDSPTGTYAAVESAGDALTQAGKQIAANMYIIIPLNTDAVSLCGCQSLAAKAGELLLQVDHCRLQKSSQLVLGLHHGETRDSKAAVVLRHCTHLLLQIGMATQLLCLQISNSLCRKACDAAQAGTCSLVESLSSRTLAPLPSISHIAQQP
jgi:hypothetical protein